MILKRYAPVIIIAIAGASFFLVACGGHTHTVTVTSSAIAVTGIHTHDFTFQGTK